MIDPTTTKIKGWLKVGGDWELHSTRKLDDYFTIDAQDVPRCLPLAITASKKSKEWSNLHGRHVVLKGKFIAYNDLSDAENSVERELNRKYFDGQIIFNQCLNDFVFYPTEISLAEH